MLKNISNLGNVMNKKEQQAINGGSLDPVKDLCVPLPPENLTCLVPINPKCCLVWG